MDNNSNNKFLIPLLLAAFFAGGIYLGTQFIPKTTTENSVSNVSDKFSTLLNETSKLFFFLWIGIYVFFDLKEFT